MEPRQWIDIANAGVSCRTQERYLMDEIKGHALELMSRKPPENPSHAKRIVSNSRVDVLRKTLGVTGRKTPFVNTSQLDRVEVLDPDCPITDWECKEDLKGVLSPLEYMVFLMWEQRYLRKEMAQRLGLPAVTVTQTVKSMKQKVRAYMESNNG